MVAVASSCNLDLVLTMLHTNFSLIWHGACLLYDAFLVLILWIIFSLNLVRICYLFFINGGIDHGA